ncbi:MAG: response regulator [Solirubrobacteraceae bacterium]|jgi:two-component system, response regulator
MGARSRLGPIPAVNLNLPKIDGLEVLKRLRAQPPKILAPIVVLTGSNEESDRLRSYTDGADAYVRKTVEGESPCPREFS